MAGSPIGFAECQEQLRRNAKQSIDRIIGKSVERFGDPGDGTALWFDRLVIEEHINEEDDFGWRLEFRLPDGSKFAVRSKMIVTDRKHTTAFSSASKAIRRSMYALTLRLLTPWKRHGCFSDASVWRSLDGSSYQQEDGAERDQGEAGPIPFKPEAGAGPPRLQSASRRCRRTSPPSAEPRPPDRRARHEEHAANN